MNTKVRQKTQGQSKTTTHSQRIPRPFSTRIILASVLLLLVGAIIFYQLLKQDSTPTQEPTRAEQETFQTQFSTSHGLTQRITSDAHDGHTHIARGNTEDSEKQEKVNDGSSDIDFKQLNAQVQDIFEQWQRKYPELAAITEMSQAEFEEKYPTLESRNALVEKVQEANAEFANNLRAIVEHVPRDVKEKAIAEFRQQVIDLWGAEATTAVIEKLRAEWGM